MLVSPHVASLFPLSMQPRLRAWFATHSMVTPLAGATLMAGHASVGEPLRGLGFAGFAISITWLTRHWMNRKERPWTLPHTQLRDACLAVETRMAAAGVPYPETRRMHALHYFSEALSRGFARALNTTVPASERRQEAYRAGRVSAFLLRPEAVHELQHWAQWTDPNLAEHVEAAYWLDFSQYLGQQKTLSMARTEPLEAYLPSVDPSTHGPWARIPIENNPAALALELHFNRGAERSSDVWDRYPAFAPQQQALEAMLAPDDFANGFLIYQLLSKGHTPCDGLPMPDMDG